jgi:hypothetical protein
MSGAYAMYNAGVYIDALKYCEQAYETDAFRTDNLLLLGKTLILFVVLSIVGIRKFYSFNHSIKPLFRSRELRLFYVAALTCHQDHIVSFTIIRYALNISINF